MKLYALPRTLNSSKLENCALKPETDLWNVNASGCLGLAAPAARPGNQMASAIRVEMLAPSGSPIRFSSFPLHCGFHPKPEASN